MIKQLKFRKTLKTVKSGAGFTLIELLVVIAVLGVLAAGVMTAINPIKRMNQAKDAKIKNDIGQIAQAEQAYFTTHLYYAPSVAELVTSQDLKSEPKMPDTNASYTVVLPTNCALETPTSWTYCTEIAVYGALKDPILLPPNPGLWCWRSSTGKVAEWPLAGCTAP